MTPTPIAARRRAVALALFVTFLWSTSWVLIRFGLDDAGLSPLVFAGVRYVVAAALLVAWVIARRGPRTLAIGDRRTLGALLGLGVILYAATQGAQFVAIANQPAATTSLVLASTPLVVSLLALVTLGEPVSTRQRMAAIAVIAGAALYFAGDLGATPVGAAAAAVCLVANAAAALLGRGVNRAGRLPADVITAVSMSAGAVVLLGVGIAVEGVPSLGARAVAVIAWLAVVNTALAYALWNVALRHLTATEASALNTAMVIQIPLLAWVFLGEGLGPPEIAGILIVAVGVFGMREGRRR